MIVVDSSGWIEFLQGTDRAVHFEPALCDLSKVVVPSIAVFEVHRIIAFKLGEESADAAISAMRKARIVDLGANLARRASLLGRAHQLALADAIIYATARECDAELWTQDAHFNGLPGVRYFPKV